MRLVFAVAAAALGLAWLLGPRATNDQAEDTGPPKPARVPLGPLPLPATSLPTAQPPASSPSQPAAHVAAATEVVELCGLGRYNAPSGAATAGVDALPEPIGREPLEQARQSMLSALRSGSPRARAAALLMEPLPEDEASRQRWASTLLQLAVESQDATVLAWAEEGCGHMTDGRACRLSLIRHRLRLEPDNAQHWAALAEEDPDASEEAWRGMQQSRRWQQAPQSLLLVTQAAIRADAPGYLRIALAAEASTRAATLPSPGNGFVSTLCGGDAPPSQGCRHVAEVMAENSDSLQLLTQGAQLGKSAGWSAERVQRLQKEVRALASGSPWAVDASQSLSCKTISGWSQHMARLQAQGELGALRAELKARDATP